MGRNIIKLSALIKTHLRTVLYITEDFATVITEMDNGSRSSGTIPFSSLILFHFPEVAK